MTLFNVFEDDDKSKRAAKDKEKADADTKAKADADAAAAKEKADREADARRIAREEAKKVVDEEIEPAPEKKAGDAPKGFATLWMMGVLMALALVFIFGEGCVPVVVVIGDGAKDVTCKQSNTSDEPLGELLRFDWWFPRSSTPAVAAPVKPATPVDTWSLSSNELQGQMLYSVTDTGKRLGWRCVQGGP